MPAEAAAPELVAACPKHMEYGPCGGVGFDGGCEVAAFPCVYLEVAPVRWHGVGSGPGITPPTAGDGSGAATRAASDGARSATRAAIAAARTRPRMAADPAPDPAPSPDAAELRARLAAGPIVVADFPARALDAESLTSCAAALRGHVDVVLAGDAGPARVQFPPAYRARLLREAGLRAWMGVNTRDRNRVALEAELAALAHAGAAAVHCVTGDHPVVGSRPDATAVFDLDSTELASLAAARGHLVSVAEAPLSPPVAARPARLLEKQRAGAELVFVNHAGGVESVRAFLSAAHELGVTLGAIACVPLIVDRGSAELIRGFTSLALPAGYLDSILAAADPRAAGIAAAAELSLRLLEIEGVVGVDLSGGAAPGAELAVAEAMAEIGDRIGVTQ
ncbi:MAG: methylenetetrahydrofolate reductase C-terminal domain-containing protein [Actinomycetales bacterium]|nr:methylenetetrahydrofolate reductase C-terminal domain-containing protein [Actinomycetales bacterium]